jgi:hypothetical protein
MYSHALDLTDLLREPPLADVPQGKDKIS